MNKVLITGSEGFTGKHLTTYLKQYDQLDLVGLDMGSESEIKMHQVDLLDMEKIRSILKVEHPDFLIHLCGITKSEHAENYYKLNVFTTINLLEALIQNDLFHTKSLFISSSAVYGHTTEMPISESSLPNPINFYGSSKMSMEIIVRQYSANYSIPTFIARPFNLVGPGQSTDFAIPNFAQQLLNIKNGLNKPILKTGSLSGARDFVDVRDVVEAYWTILNHGASGEVYNISSGTATNIRDILEKMIERMGLHSSVTIEEQPASPGNIPELTGDSTKLKKLGWIPKVTLEQSISDLITSIENKHDT